MSATGRKPSWVYLTVVVALVASIRIGWGDFDLHVPQEVVQETIRTGPRAVVQLLVQFAVPAALIGFLAKEGVALARSRKG